MADHTVETLRAGPILSMGWGRLTRQEAAWGRVGVRNG